MMFVCVGRVFTVVAGNPSPIVRLSTVVFEGDEVVAASADDVDDVKLVTPLAVISETEELLKVLEALVSDKAVLEFLLVADSEVEVVSAEGDVVAAGPELLS